jgi:hypothetical protein
MGGGWVTTRSPVLGAVLSIGGCWLCPQPNWPVTLGEGPPHSGYTCVMRMPLWFPQYTEQSCSATDTLSHNMHTLFIHSVFQFL